MNYIALINQFWQLRREVTFSSTEADLYFYLLEISNGLNWKNPFQQSNALIGATIGVSEKPLITARNRLKQHGLIDFTPGVKRSPSTYTLLSLENLQPNRGESGSKSGSESGSECDSLSGENPPDINKHKLNKGEDAADAAPPAPSLDSASAASPPPASPPPPADRPVAPPAKPDRPAGRAKKSTASPDEVATLPLPHPGDEFAQLWATFRTGPQQARKPLSAFEMMLKKLGKYPEAFALVMLEAAIQGGWSGIENAGTARAYAEWQAEQARKPTTPPASAPAPPIDTAALFGHTQTVAEGLARARQDPAYQRFLAEQAARTIPAETALAA